MRVILKPGRDRSVRAGHPWVFSGAVAAVEEEGAAGGVTEVRAADRRLLGRGMWNPKTSIAVRMLTAGDEPVDDGFVRRRLETALRLRALVRETDAMRLVNGEGDGLPGVVVDRYGPFVVVQLLHAGADAMRPALVEALSALVEPRGIFERSEGSVRNAEGLAPATGVLTGEAPPEDLVVVEGGRRYLADVQHGQKTGLFLDQRPARELVRTLAAGRRVLNLFAYSGAFAVAAAQGEAHHVVSVEASAPALARAEEIWRLNRLAPEAATFTRADVFAHLRQGVAPADLVILDPPPFARRRTDHRRALAGYRDVNLHALKACAPDALVVTFSCSQHVSAADFRDTVAAAAADARRPCQILDRLGPGIDHPQALAHPEGRYLKGLLLRVGER